MLYVLSLNVLSRVASVQVILLSGPLLLVMVSMLLDAGSLALDVALALLELFAFSLLDAGASLLELGVVMSLLEASTEEELSEDVVGAVLEESSPQLAQNMLVRTNANFFQFL